MNQESSTTWHQTLQDDPMLVANDDDFNNFLQLGIGFPGFDEGQGDQNGFDTPMGDLGMDQLAMESSLEELSRHTTHAAASSSGPRQQDLMPSYSDVAVVASSLSSEASVQNQHQQHRQGNIQHSSYDHRIMIPPTPRSTEMQGAAARFRRFSDDEGMSEFERGQRRKGDQVILKAMHKNGG
jgi:hypothetical protein